MPSDCGPAFGSTQRPRPREAARATALAVHRSSTGHTCRTEFEHYDSWQGNIARMQGAGLGNSSVCILPVPKPANDTADPCQIYVLMVTTAHIFTDAQKPMSGLLHFFWSSGATWRSRARHVGRAQTAGPKRTRASGTADQVNDGRTACLGSCSGQKMSRRACESRGTGGGAFEGTKPPPSDVIARSRERPFALWPYLPTPCTMEAP